MRSNTLLGTLLRAPTNTATRQRPKTTEPENGHRIKYLLMDNSNPSTRINPVEISATSRPLQKNQDSCIRGFCGSASCDDRQFLG
jgi:hypothetical protein